MGEATKIHAATVTIGPDVPQPLIEKPILFSAEMVRAILSGTKTQSRRVIKPQPPAGFTVDLCPWSRTAWGLWKLKENGERHHCTCKPVTCPYDADRLWIHETFRIESFGADVAQIRYTADNARGRSAGVSDRKLPNRIGTVAAIHMPRHCSRITLEITSVRVERLQSITQGDIRSEGCPDYSSKPEFQYVAEYGWFISLWDKSNPKHPWASNPYVWTIEFKRIDS